MISATQAQRPSFANTLLCDMFLNFVVCVSECNYLRLERLCSFYCSRIPPVPLMRALVPVAIGVTAGGGFTFRWWLQQVVSDLAANAAVVVGRELIIQQVLDNIDWQPLIIFSWYLGSLVICWELRNDILEVLRISATFLLWCLGYLIWFWTWLSSAGYLGTVLDHPTSASARTELQPRAEITCMAVAGGGVAFPVGTFLLVSRPPNWDEIWVAGYTKEKGEIIGRTTMTDGSDWVWTVIKVTGQGLQASVAGANGRTPPPGLGIQSRQVNWLCTPPDCMEQWEPDMQQGLALTQEALQVAKHVEENLNVVAVNVLVRVVRWLLW